MESQPTGFFVIERGPRHVRSIHSSWREAVAEIHWIGVFESRPHPTDDFAVGIADRDYWADPYLRRGVRWDKCQDKRVQS
jgi:hypothetical protein